MARREKRKTHPRKRNFQRARGREEILHTWERERSFSEKERSDLFFAKAHKSR